MEDTGQGLKVCCEDIIEEREHIFWVPSILSLMDLWALSLWQKLKGTRLLKFHVMNKHEERA